MKSLITKAVTGIYAVAMIFSIAVMPAIAAVTSGYTLSGGAEYVAPAAGNSSMQAVKMVSDTTDPYSRIAFTVLPGTTFADITQLSTDFWVQSDDLCVGGSPRFQIRVEETGPADSDPTGDNIFVYFENGVCTPGTWLNTGDLLEATKTVDTSQLGGTFYDPYLNALAQYGNLNVSGISLVVDAGWAAADGEQTIQIDNTQINEVPYSYEPTREEHIKSCKGGGWQTHSSGPFKNQGDCVSFFATGGKNLPSGN